MQKGKKQKRKSCLLPHSPIHPPTHNAEFTGQPGLLSAVLKTLQSLVQAIVQNKEIGFV